MLQRLPARLLCRGHRGISTFSSHPQYRMPLDVLAKASPSDVCALVYATHATVRCGTDQGANVDVTVVYKPLDEGQSVDAVRATLNCPLWGGSSNAFDTGAEALPAQCEKSTPRENRDCKVCQGSAYYCSHPPFARDYSKPSFTDGWMHTWWPKSPQMAIVANMQLRIGAQQALYDMEIQGNTALLNTDDGRIALAKRIHEIVRNDMVLFGDQPLVTLASIETFAPYKRGQHAVKNAVHAPILVTAGKAPFWIHGLLDLQEPNHFADVVKLRDRLLGHAVTQGHTRYDDGCIDHLINALEREERDYGLLEGTVPLQTPGESEDDDDERVDAAWRKQWHANLLLSRLLMEKCLHRSDGKRR